jgi:hypothetical protein
VKRARTMIPRIDIPCPWCGAVTYISSDGPYLGAWLYCSGFGRKRCEWATTWTRSLADRFGSGPQAS